MKKILLSLMTICAFVLVKAQTCGTGAIYHWTDAVPNTATGNQGATPAPISINGTSADWEQYITGPFGYTTLPANGFEPNPYTSPIAPANVQLDGLRDATGSDYDRDVPGQDHRDLRYFAFTYDQKNVYFIFRRPKNNTAQVSLYYFIDINVDGYMAQGEPVIHVTFNNSGSSIEMGYYQPVDFNSTAPGSYDPIKGNIMSVPQGVTRAKNSPNTSQWQPGAADGWNMPGNFIAFGNNVTLPAIAPGEVFDSKTLTDTYTGGTTAAGYGVEFAVPWQYFRLYNAQGAILASAPLNYNNVFTWHVSLVSGASGISGAEDNAGGCCAGLAVSGTPNIVGTPSYSTSSIYDFRYNISYQEMRNLNSAVQTNQIIIKNPQDANGADIPLSNIQTWTLTGYKDATCDATADGSGIVFTLNTSLSYPVVPASPDKVYVFIPNVATDTKMFISAGQTSCFFLNLNTAASWPPLKIATIAFNSSTEFNLNTITCNPENASGSAGGNLSVLPVKFTTFNAVRNGSNVNLSWQTSSEENNTGFEIQRFLGVGGWEKIGFVATQALNGTSSSALNYQFTDINNSKGITQYRLRQVDKDNRSAYSVIRSVRGNGQIGKTIVYPNPSSDGKVNILFDDASGIRDISLMDMSGRVIKQMRGVTNNNVVIDNLTAGFYTVRIVNNATGEQVVEKFVVNKR